MTDRKKLLVLSGAAQLIEIVQDAKEAGYYVIVTDYLDNSPAKKFADESWDLSITDVDGIVEKCRQEHVDGVMNYCIDPGQKPYQQICEKLGLPCVAGKEQFDIMTNKDRFKEACLQYGVDIIPGFTSFEDVPSIEQLNSLKYPVIVKPVDGRASKGMSKCETEDELLHLGIPNALQNSRQKGYVVEKCIDNDEMIIKYVACDGHIYLTTMSDVYNSYTKDHIRVYMGSQSYPSKHYHEYLNKVNDKVINMLKSIGIKNGAISMTGFYDNGVFRFFDPSLRMGGAQDWRIPGYITGVDISKLLTNFAITGEMGDSDFVKKIDKGFADKASALFYFDIKPGIFGKVEGIESCLNLDGVVGYHLCHQAGDEIIGYGTADNVALRFILVCDFWKELKELMFKIQDIIVVTDANGEDMTVGKFDPNLLPVDNNVVLEK